MTLLEEGNQFIATLLQHIENEPFLEDCTIDHVCYRAQTINTYSFYKKKWSSDYKILSENSVNGREITIFELKIPFSFNNQKIHLLELPEPKNGRNDKDGFEHLELVTKTNLRKLVELYPNLNFNTKNIDTQLPEIRLNYLAGSIKIRNIGLREVLNMEW